MDSYIPLHLHTMYGSILDSMVNPLKENKGDCLLSLKAKEYGMPALAITDHGSMSGVISHYKTCKEYGIKPILGCEFYVCDDIKIKDKNSKYNHLVVLAKNYEGYQNLKKLSSIGYLDGFYYKPRIDFETLSKYSEGLICMTACLGGELPKMIMECHKLQQQNITPEEINEYMVKFMCNYKGLFGDDFYLEIQSSDSEEQIIVNKKLVDMSQSWNVPLVVTTDVHFLNKEDFEAHNVFININQDRDTENYKYCYLQSRDEIVNILAPQIGIKNAELALDNTYLVANKCNVELTLHDPKLPHLDVPIDYDDESDWLREVAYKGLKDKGLYNKEYIDRVNMELDVIITKGFEGYFLILMEIIKEAKKRGIPIGEGRGSAAGSVVAYCLGITNVDSIEYDLDFGRFLTMERKDLPDVDSDVATSRRGDLIDLVVEMFGYENVSQIATFGTLASKACIDSVSKVMKIDKSITSKLKDKIIDDDVSSLKKTKEYKEYKHFIDICTKIQGCPRNVSSHAGGVCISGDNKQTVEYVPIMLNKDDRVISQFEMHDVEDCNLVKYDMLGLASLDYIDDCLKFVGSDYYSFEFDYNDKETFDMLSSGNNLGVFQADSNFAERVFTNVKPQSITEVADCISIGRPDSIKFLEPYVDAKFKGIMPKQIHPLFNDILSRTYGCLIYQEQLMRIFKVFANFSDGEADGVRKCVAKKNLEKMDYYFNLFRKGAKENGYDNEVIEQIIEFVKDNASYSFNQSHAVAYGITTYKTAYLRCHYPVEYMAAIINNQRTEDGSTDFDKIKRFIKIAESDGIQVISPDVSTSGLKFTPTKEGNITYGLGLIKGLSAIGCNIVIANQPYDSFKDFLDRVGLLIGKSDMVSLVKANAFRNITDESQMQQFAYYNELRFLNGKEDKKPIKKVNKTHIKYLLDEGLIDPETSEDKETCIEILNRERLTDSWREFKNKYCKGTQLDWEMEVLSSHLSGDPFEGVYTGDWDKVNLESKGYVGGVLLSVKETTTKKGEKMCFLNITVGKEIFDIVVFPKSYLQYKPLLKAGNCIVCKTTKQGDKKGILQSCEMLQDFVLRTRSVQPKEVLDRYAKSN